jgi:outer membrane protein OmpA-like peptidoglycan-associated protein
MTTHAFTPVSSAYRIFRAVYWMAGLASLVTFGSPARAQVVIGGNTSPNVTIDYSVLDELGRAPNVPQLLSGQPPNAPLYPYEYRNQPRFPVISDDGAVAGSNRIVLKPPSQIKRRSTRRTTPARPAGQQTAKKPAERTPATTQRPPRTQERTATAKPRSLTPPPPPPMTEAPSTIPPPPPMSAPAAKPAPTPPEERIAALPPPATSRTPPAPPAAVPEAAPRATTPPPAAPAETARATPARPGSLRRIAFSPGSAKLNAAAAAELKEMAEAMKRDSALRIQLLAYAGEASDSASQARRLSLSRAPHGRS